MVGTPIPVLFLGRDGTTAAEVFETNSGFEDGFNGGAGDAISIKGRTVRIAPAGVSGECLFTTFWVMVEHTMAVTLRFTPILDDVVYDGTGGNPDLRQTVALGSLAVRTVETFEFALSLPYDDGGGEQIRTALRGTWFQLEVDSSTALATGDLILHQTELEFEVVRETQQAE